MTLTGPAPTHLAGAGASARSRRRRRPNHGRFPLIGWLGLGIVGFFAAVAVVGPSIAPYAPKGISAPGLETPSWAHPLGTTRIGQDLFSQLLVGARASMTMAALAGLGVVALGAVIGITAGWFGGWVDSLLMRVVDVFLAFPRLPALMLLGAYLGTNLTAISLVITLLFWPGTARVVRGQVMSLRRRMHLQAASGFGAGSFHLVRRHVLPETGLLLVAALVGAAGRAIILEAGLAFLGLGDPARVSWGAMIRDARLVPGIFYTDMWIWRILPPLSAIVLVMVGMTFLGVGFEQRLNPRLSRHVTNQT